MGASAIPGIARSSTNVSAPSPACGRGGEGSRSAHDSAIARHADRVASGVVLRGDLRRRRRQARISAPGSTPMG